jgi:hypothetical protein
MPPYMPPMMGGMGQRDGQSKERQRSTWLTEDEEVWGTDPEVSPAVIGRVDGAAPGEEDEPRRPTHVAPPPTRERGRR